MKRLLAATDLSARSERALRRAVSLSRQFSAELQILHVVDADQPREIVEQEVRQAGESLARQVEALCDVASARPTVVIKSGNPFQEIVKTAVEREADLIVMGSHRRRILRDVFVGTMIERVMRTGHHPVLMVNAEPGQSYSRALAAVDMSDASANALLTAKCFGLFDETYLSIVHAFAPLAKDMMIYAGIEQENVKEHVVQESASARKDLTSFLAGLDLGELTYDLRLEEGQPFAAIQKVVKKEKPDLLVIGTRGLTGIKRVLLGSVADEVLRNITCDILTVPPRPEQTSTSTAS